MFKYLFLNITLLYLILNVYVNILCHTVVNTSELLPPYQNETFSAESKIEQVKRRDKKQEVAEVSNKSGTVTIPENKIVTPVLNNSAAVHNTPLTGDDEFNSTASLPWMLNIKEGALERTGYVALGFMFIVLTFFVIRAVRIRQKRSKSRKYGIITSTASDMEMEPLDKDDDDEEDATLFDAQHKYSLQ